MPFGSLWMPVLASAVAVFVVSSILHMALRYHRADSRDVLKFGERSCIYIQFALD